jgi:hypothetical protein
MYFRRIMADIISAGYCLAVSAVVWENLIGGMKSPIALSL